MGMADPVCPHCETVLIDGADRAAMDRKCVLGACECGGVCGFGILLIASSWFLWEGLAAVGATLVILSILPFIGNWHIHRHLSRSEDTQV
jgi:hypothetical protein